MSYKLFLDDYRQPLDCAMYMHQRIGPENPIYTGEWVVVKNYTEFCTVITEKGLPNIVSFDHDLADEHYALAGDNHFDFKEKTGYDCAKWLVEYCIKEEKKLPRWFVHSMNPVGSENIKRYLELAEK